MSTEPGIVGQPSVSLGKKRPNAMEWVRVFDRSALINCELLRGGEVGLVIHFPGSGLERVTVT